jgi:hypothetical protein
MFAGETRVAGASKLTRRSDGEHFDFLCSCGCENFNMAYRLFKLWCDEKGEWYIDYPCPRCGLEHPIRCPLDFRPPDSRG